jgi:hypothetical protein
MTWLPDVGPMRQRAGPTHAEVPSVKGGMEVGLRCWQLPLAASGILAMALVYASTAPTEPERQARSTWDVPVGPSPPGACAAADFPEASRGPPSAPARPQPQALAAAVREGPSVLAVAAPAEVEGTSEVVVVPPAPDLPAEDGMASLEGAETLRDALQEPGVEAVVAQSVAGDAAAAEVQEEAAGEPAPAPPPPDEVP